MTKIAVIVGLILAAIGSSLMGTNMRLAGQRVEMVVFDTLSVALFAYSYVLLYRWHKARKARKTGEFIRRGR